MPSSIRRIDVAGRDVTEYLQRRSGYVFRTSAEKEVVRLIKGTVSYIAPDPGKEEADIQILVFKRLEFLSLEQLISGIRHQESGNDLGVPVLLDFLHTNSPRCGLLALLVSKRVHVVILGKELDELWAHLAVGWFLHAMLAGWAHASQDNQSWLDFGALYLH
ncbi:hypothetical protein MY4824_008152 [Beauveria thailandica]